MAKSGPKGPRAKVRRVLLIEGHPDCLFTKVPRDFYALVWKGVPYRLGKCGDGLPKALKDMNPRAIITHESRVSSRPEPLPEVLRASIKKVGDNTHITVSAVDDKGLAEEIDKVCEYLEGLGMSVTQRCHWTCDYDPGSKAAPAPVTIDEVKVHNHVLSASEVLAEFSANSTTTPTPAPKPLPTPKPTPYPVSYDLATGKVDCGVYKKTMLFPRDCDICIMKKHCGTYAEMKARITNMEVYKNAIGQK